jgi:hypothetical protein
VKLGEIGVSLEDIEEIKCELQTFLELIPESSGDCAEQGLVLNHELHVFVRKAQEEQTHRSLHLLLYLLVVELLQIVIHLVN